MSTFSGGGGGGPFGPPGPFASLGVGGSPFARPQQSPSPVMAPSSNPADSTLYQRAPGLHLPDLLAFIQGWHKGKTARDATGGQVTLVWHALEVVHLDTATAIYVHSCSSSDQDKDVAELIQQRIEHRARGMGDGSMQRFEVRCHFRSPDGRITAVEPYTVPVTLPPANPQWGQAHYGGMGSGGGGFGGGGGGFGGGGGGLGSANAFGMTLHRGLIDATQMAHQVLFRALDMVENHSRRLEASNARHEEREMDRVRLMDELQNTAHTRKLQENLAELKLATLQTALEKFMTALPLGFVVLNRWLNGKREEQGQAAPREKKLWETLRRLTDELQKNPQMAENPQMLGMMLQGAGATEETVTDIYQTLQEFAFDKMMANAEQQTKQTLLGVGEGDTGLRRLLKVAGVKVPGEGDPPANANEGGDKAAGGSK